MLRKQIGGCAAALSPFFKPGKTFRDADKRGKGMEEGGKKGFRDKQILVIGHPEKYECSSNQRARAVVLYGDVMLGYMRVLQRCK